MSGVISTGCRGTQYSTMVSHMGCTGISTPAPGAPPLPPSLNFALTGLFFTFLLLTLPRHVLSFLKYIFTEVPPSWLRGSALSYTGSIGASRSLPSGTRQPLVSSHRSCLSASSFFTPTNTLTPPPNGYNKISVAKKGVY